MNKADSSLEEAVLMGWLWPVVKPFVPMFPIAPTTRFSSSNATGWSVVRGLGRKWAWRTRRPPRLDRGTRGEKEHTQEIRQLSKAWTTCLALHHDIIFDYLTAAVLLQRGLEVLPFRLGEVARHHSFAARLLLELLDDVSDASALLLRQGALETG